MNGIPHLVDQLVEKCADSALSDDDCPADQVRNLEQCLSRFAKASPFPAERRGFFSVDDVRGLSTREFERVLKRSGVFGKGASRMLAERYRGPDDAEDDVAKASIIDDIRATQKSLRQCA